MYMCLEGIDGSGKSTQTALLEKWLQNCGLQVFRIFEPTDSKVGLLIREMLQDPGATDENFQRTLALLFAADRTILMEKIAHAESEGQIVVSDRCFYSSMVYQDGAEWIGEINRFVRKPDVTLLLDLDPETAMTRCEGSDSFEDLNFLMRTRSRYLELAEKEGFFILNANNGINKVHEDIKRVIAPKLGMCI
ncbi:dTMP kinase [Methanobacterium aggregans]|uniref:dTMP kinase n=1 Tax=Methanobacterium aggregans TaxID=1615586 RepID=UPI001AE50BAD|nr:dTMP kinase [Methanobacterium aggregans]MBP2046477.1 dTMP kinase [Methanobacterium aggregans]